MLMTKIVDTVVVGAGVAGLSAALFLGRAGLSTIIYDGGPQRIMVVDRVREYLGFDGLTPTEMLARLRGEVACYGASIRQQRVRRIESRENGLFDIWTADDMVTARTVVLATGLVDELPLIQGIPEVWGRDLRVCPCFDGYEVRDQRFVVFGLPQRIAHMGAWVSMWSPQVSVVSKHAFNEADAKKLRLLNITVVQDEVTGLIHRDGRLAGVSTQSGTEIACDATWVAMSYKATSNLAASLCDVDEAGLAQTDAGGLTSRPGVFAIGNASAGGAWAHLAHAAAAGTNVGPLVTMYLLEARIATRDVRVESISDWSRQQHD